MNFKQHLYLCRTVKFKDRQNILSLLRLYRGLETQARRFQKATGLKCLRGCGQCCENNNVEATVFELLPLALDLWRRKEAESWLKELSKATESSLCVFYSNEGLGGRCLVYPFRPSVCRLFGFSATHDKHGNRVLVTCARMKQSLSRQYQKAQQLLGEGYPAPEMLDFARRVACLGDLSEKPLPIKQAIKTALEKVGLLLEYRGKT